MTVLSYPCGTEYIGDVVDGLPCGQGQLHLPSGVVCTGAFQNGEAHGLAVQVMPNGDMYVGQFKGGRRYGQGKFVFAAIDLEVRGQWVDGVFLRNAGSKLGPVLTRK